ncbi:MAG: BamA/TamA family outer membrane protein, partial [Kovacikia sp.]
PPDSRLPTPPASEASTPNSFSDPIWVVPDQTVPGQTIPSDKVTVPEVFPIQPPTPPYPVPAKPAGSPGLVVTATDVQIVGAEPELQQVVRNAIKTQPGGQTSKSQLDQDVAEILDTGLFANARVSSRPNPNGLSVIFTVEPIVVRELRLSGAQALTQPLAEDLFKPQLGAIVSPSGLTQAVQRINQWYAQSGYTLARVITLEPTREGVVIITVAEGLVGDIQIRFVNKQGKPVDDQGQPITHRTQEGFIRDNIQLKPGQVFREEVVRQDLRRLNGLGIFQSVNVSFEGDARRTTVIYNIAEGKSRGFNFGAGYNDDLGIFGTISYQDNNFGGLAQKASTNVQVGTRDVQFDARFVSPYRDIYPGVPGYSANFSRRQGLSRVFYDPIELPNGDRVRERRIGGGADLSYPLGPTWMGTLGINYTNISIRDSKGRISPVDSKGNPLTLSGTGIDDLTTLSFNTTQDRRDNPVNPRNGSYLSLRSEQTIPIGRGEILGNTLVANYAQYIPTDLIQGLKGDQPQVFAFNFQTGTVLGDLPPYNAFVLGGSDSVRGYGFGDLASSRSYALASAEYRFPIYRFIGGVVFFDAATDFGSQGAVPGEPGTQRDLPGSGFGTGLGLRITSPIGIIRADFGISNGGDTQLHFGFGQKF